MKYERKNKYDGIFKKYADCCFRWRAVGKTWAADMKLAGSEVRLWDAMPFAASSLKDIDKS